MSHKNIIKFHSFFAYDNRFYTVMDYARGGELSSLLENKKKLVEEEAKLYFKQIYNAVCYIHGKNIIHRDLKPNNVLFLDEEKTHLVIIDFGISGFSNGNQKEQVKAGTVKFLPPEILSGKELSSNTKLDMWALGIILYRMVEGFYPFDGKNYKEIINNIFKNKLEFSPKIKISTPLKQLIEGLLEKNYRFRIDNDNELFNKWFNHKIVINNKYIKRKSKKNDVEEDLYNIDYFNKYYSIERYSKYYEDENERKIIQSLSNKACNSYLSQTKSTSMKCKPKIFYIKNDYSYMKKNSLPYKIELSRSAKKKDFIYNINEKKEKDNENEKNDYNNKIILPLISNKSSNNNLDFNYDINSDKIFLGRDGKNKMLHAGQRKSFSISLFNNNIYNKTHYLAKSNDNSNDNITINNGEINNYQISGFNNKNTKIKLGYKFSDSNDITNKSISPFKLKNYNILSNKKIVLVDKK